MVPEGGSAATECNGEECARSPHKGCMCGSYGRFARVEIGWQTEGLTVLLTEYERGTIWAMVYGGVPLTEAEQEFLDSLADEVAEAVDVWTHRGPAMDRMHFYGSLRP